MRIAFFVQAFPAVSETFILHQITGLLDRGYEVAIFAETRSDTGTVHAQVEEYDLLERAVYLDEEWSGQSGLASARALARRAPRLLARLPRTDAGAYGGRRPLARKLAVLLASGFDPHVVHCHFGDVALRRRYVSLAWPVPFVASFYGHDASRLPERRGRQVYRPLAGSVDCVTVLSRAMRRRLSELGFPEDVVCEQRIGVDPRRFPFRERAPDPGSGEVRLLTVARLVEKKGVDHALRALARLDDRHRFSYEVIGDGPLRGELEELARSLGLASRVRFRGSRPQSDVEEAMKKAHLFLLPSVTAADGDQEGTPTVLMEASAAGLPVVSTLHAGIPEVVRDGRTGLLVPEGDDRALARALDHLLSNPEEWPRLGREGRQHVERRYDIRVLVDELVDLYGSLLEDRGPEGDREVSPAASPAHPGGEAAAGITRTG